MKTYDLDEILAERGPDIRVAIQERYEELLRGFPLSSLRVDCGMSQSDVAAKLKVSQAAVSKMESRSDMLLSTLHRYVGALGGAINFCISVGERDYKIEPSSEKGTSFVLQSEQRASPSVLFGNASVKLHRRQSAESSISGLWAHKRTSAHDVTIHDQFSRIVANDHECEAWLDAA